MRLKTLLTTLGLGAGAMYFFDPRQGTRRRSMIRDQFNRTVNQANDAVDTAVIDLRNRTRGVLAEMAGRLENEDPSGWVLEERVRARLGRQLRRSGIDVRSDGNRIILSGPVLRENVDQVIRLASRTRGVREIDNQLQVFDNPQDMPSIKGQAPIIQNGGSRRWSPSTRLLAGVGGGTLALYGMARKGIVGPALSLTGLYLAARSVTNQQLSALLGMSETGFAGAGENAIHVNKAINIDAPIDQVYQFWANFENFPLFMEHVKEITTQGGKSHWKVAGPAGSTVEFDAITTRDMPNESIAWQTLPESQVHHDGFVRFDENRDGTTRVSVHMNYIPPAGVVGHAVARLFGVDPRQSMHDDLVRLKTLLEEGKTSTSENKVRLRQKSDRATGSAGQF